MSWTNSASPYIGQILDAAFDRAQAVVVLFTPDEVAYLQPTYGHGDSDPEIQPAAQARPNVLFEAGMAMGSHPDRTVLVELGDVRPFSDVAGRHAVRMNNEAQKRKDLSQRLEHAGCAVSMAGDDWLRAGDFTPPPPPGKGLPIGRRIPSQIGQRGISLRAKYHHRSNGSDRLQIQNVGSETLYDLTVTLPPRCRLHIYQDSDPGLLHG
jgi:hypothetical protein